MDIWIILSLWPGVSEFSLNIYPYCLARHAFPSCRILLSIDQASLTPLTC